MSVRRRTDRVDEVVAGAEAFAASLTAISNAAADLYAMRQLLSTIPASASSDVRIPLALSLPYLLTISASSLLKSNDWCRRKRCRARRRLGTRSRHLPRGRKSPSPAWSPRHSSRPRKPKRPPAPPRPRPFCGLGESPYNPKQFPRSCAVITLSSPLYLCSRRSMSFFMLRTTSRSRATSMSFSMVT